MTKREFLDKVFALVPNEANAIMDAFDEYVESNEPHWIPVKDQLPELDEWVLVSSEGGVIADSMVIRNGERIWYASGDILEDDHWMPLPDPWKGE